MAAFRVPVLTDEEILMAVSGLYTRVYVSIIQDPKMLDLKDLIGYERDKTIGLLTMFWIYCLTYAPNGNLADKNPRHIAKFCDWKGEPAALIAALIEAGWIDKEELTVHGWFEHSGQIFVYRQKNAEKKMEWRQQKAQKLRALSEPEPNPQAPVRGFMGGHQPLQRHDQYEDYLSFYTRNVGVDGITDNQRFEADMNELCQYPFDQYKRAVFAMIRQKGKKPDLRVCPNYVDGILTSWKQNGEPLPQGNYGGKQVAQEPVRQYKAVN